MRNRLSPLLAAALLSSAAVAQTAPSPPPATSAPAPAAPAPAPMPNSTEPAPTGATAPRQDATAPLPGANSFTEAQAKSRIEQQGFSGVSGLQKDDKGVWRGAAMKDGKSMTVMLDFRGNVAAQ